MSRLTISPASSIISGVEWMLKLTDAITAQKAGCLETLLKSRGSSLCTTCSGRSEHFFAAGKVLISDKACTDLVGRCKTYLTFPLKLTEFLNPYFQSISPLNNGPVLSKLRQSLIFKDRESLFTLKRELENDNTKGKVIFCERLTRLQKDLFLHRIIPELILARDSTEVIISDYKKIIQNMPTNWSVTKRILSRLLQSDVNFEQLFAGDAIVVPPVPSKVDSSYASFFGAAGSSGNEASSSLQLIPVNLTSMFP